MIYWTMFPYEEEYYTIAATEQGLCFFGNDFVEKADFLQWAIKKGWQDLQEDASKLSEAITEIKAYFQGQQQAFQLPLDPKGTVFQQQVWEALQTVPYGETASYSDIAEKIGKKQAVRAVANAIGANPILIIVPCHRVIGKNGKLTGFRGGLPLKRQLLAIEGNVMTI